jgi:hypothetical protein
MSLRPSTRCPSPRACSRAHVKRRAGEAWAAADILFSQRQAKVRHERFVLGVEQKVAGLDVAMNQPVAMGMMQRGDDLRDQLRAVGRARRIVLDALFQRAAFDELRDDEEGELVATADVVNGHDVGAIQLGERAGFGEIGVGVLRIGDILAMVEAILAGSRERGS